MIQMMDFYYFSPTGGTKKAGSILANAMAGQVNLIDLGKAEPLKEGGCGTVLIAAPVFGGRIPAFVSEKIKSLNGSGKTAVTMVVYGVRAYDDALLELNDVVTEAGFRIAGSAAVVAQHSIVPFVGIGRPDDQDVKDLMTFASDVLTKLEKGTISKIHVPGNRPYKEIMNLPAAPVCLPSCISCGTCMVVCPVGAMKMEENKITTDVQKCILCMACTAACPSNARILPPPLQESMNEKLGQLKDVHRDNEFYL